MLFNAELEWNISTSEMIRPPTDPQFVGTPTVEIDNAWSEILPGTVSRSHFCPYHFGKNANIGSLEAVTIWVTPEEARQQFPDNDRLYYGEEYQLHKGQ
jgi:hypothetical protein